MSLLTVQAAQERILSNFKPVETETIPLEQAAGRVLAADVIASDLPSFDNSSVDGFAVIGADLANASTASPQTLEVVADIPAGSVPSVRLARGQAARIMTGAPVPEGADAVIMLEDTDFVRFDKGASAPASVKAFSAIKNGENVRKRGMDTKSGDRVLFTGRLLRAPDVGLLAMLGVPTVSVYRRPRIALMSSGDELRPLGVPLEIGKIRDSNSYALAAMIVEAGCEHIPLGIAADEQEAILFLLNQAVSINADLILSSAGVSVGAFDYIKSAIETNGQLDFWRVNMRPGKPLAFGKYQDVLFLGLPGNPVSALVCFEVFARPALERLRGLKGATRPRVRVRLAEAIESDGRESYLRASVEERQGVLSARLTGHQGSGNLFSLVQADALLIVPAGVKSLAIGSEVDAWLL